MACANTIKNICFKFKPKMKTATKNEKTKKQNNNECTAHSTSTAHALLHFFQLNKAKIKKIIWWKNGQILCQEVEREADEGKKNDGKWQDEIQNNFYDRLSVNCAGEIASRDNRNVRDNKNDD